MITISSIMEKAFLLGILLVPFGVFAQSSNYPSAWTLENCIAFAKQNNISINSLRLSKNSAQQDLLQAKEAKYPNLNGTFSQGLFAVNGKNGLNVNGAQSQSIGANSSMTLYHDHYIKNNEMSKNLLLQMSDLSVKEAENNISVSIAQAFLNILMMKENIVSIESLLQTSEIQLKQGSQLYNAGSISKLQYLQLEIQFAQDQFNLVQAQNSLRSDVLNLKQLLQLPSDYDLQISSPENITVSAGIRSLGEIQNTAQNSRPEIKYSELNVQNAETGLKMAQASIKPTLNLVGNISTGYNFGNGGYLNQLGNNFYLPVGLSLGIPIYNNRIYKTSIEKSKIEIDQAHLNLKNTQLTLNQQIEQAYISLQNSVSQYESAQKQFDLNRQSLDIVNAEMKIGSINYVQLQQQRLLYIQALQNYLQAKYSAVLNRQIYEFYSTNQITLQ